MGDSAHELLAPNVMTERVAADMDAVPPIRHYGNGRAMDRDGVQYARADCARRAAREVQLVSGEQ
jgi:hypothetical protein